MHSLKKEAVVCCTHRGKPTCLPVRALMVGFTQPCWVAASVKQTITALIIWSISHNFFDVQPLQLAVNCRIGCGFGESGKEGALTSKIQHILSCQCGSSCSHVGTGKRCVEFNLKREWIGDYQKEYLSKPDYLSSVWLKLLACCELPNLKMK